MKKRILIILTIVWMAFIFFMSGRSASESARASVNVGRLAASLFVPGYSEWPEADQLELARRIDWPVRKTAHFTEYAILGILVSGAAAAIAAGGSGGRGPKKAVAAGDSPGQDPKPAVTAEDSPERIRCFWRYTGRIMTISLLICAAYAVSDEIHQLFAPGRAGMSVDVLLDCAGAFAGVCIGACVWRPWVSRRPKQ